MQRVHVWLLESEDGIVGFACPAHLHVSEAGQPEHMCVVRRRLLLPLRLNQHVQGEELGHDGTSVVLKQHSLYQQNTSTCMHTRTHTHSESGCCNLLVLY